jgi:hypothetical protein
MRKIPLAIIGSSHTLNPAPRLEPRDRVRGAAPAPRSSEKTRFFYAGHSAKVRRLKSGIIAKHALYDALAEAFKEAIDMQFQHCQRLSGDNDRLVFFRLSL